MGGRRDPDAIDVRNVVPLCRICHTEIHQVGRDTWPERHGLDLEQEAERVWKVWMNLPPTERAYWEQTAREAA